MKSERLMYPHIAKYLETQKRCRYVQSERVRFTYVKGWTIDVVGMSGAKVYGVEAKKSFTFDSVSAAIQQATFYKSGCTHVYLSFPAHAYRTGKEEIRHFLVSRCLQEGFGILLVDESGDVTEERPIPGSSAVEVDFSIYHDVVLQLTSETPSDEVQGGRAFVVRDVCHLIEHSKILSTGALLEEFFANIPEDDVGYWKGQKGHHINPRTKPTRTLSSSIRAAMDLGLIEQTEEGLENTLLGRILCSCVDDDHLWTVRIGERVKWVFYLVALRYPEVRCLLSILSDLNRKLRWHSSTCDYCGSRGGDILRIEKTHVSCRSCGKELDPDSDNLSLKAKIQLEMGFDAYKQLAFWTNSNVLPVKTSANNQFIRYDAQRLME